MIEYINGYDLFELSNRVGSMDERTVRHIMKQIVDIVVTLARHQIVHRDIKDENIMINELSQGMGFRDRHIYALLGEFSHP